jgi:hypothetical protein
MLAKVGMGLIALGAKLLNGKAYPSQRGNNYVAVRTKMKGKGGRSSSSVSSSRSSRR